MTIQYRVTIVESERGWGRKYDHVDFDTVEKAIEYRDNINAMNKPGPVPDWYMIAEDDIRVIETV